MSKSMKILTLSAIMAVLAGTPAQPALAQQGPVGGAPIFGAPPAGALNLTGKWVNAEPMAALKTLDGKEPPLNARGRAELAKRKANPKSDPNTLCQIQGIPRLLYTAYPFLILHFQTHVDFVHEVNHTFRIVRVGKALDPESDILWLGNPDRKSTRLNSSH